MSAIHETSGPKWSPQILSTMTDAERKQKITAELGKAFRAGSVIPLHVTGNAHGTLAMQQKSHKVQALALDSSSDIDISSRIPSSKTKESAPKSMEDIVHALRNADAFRVGDMTFMTRAKFDQLAEASKKVQVIPTTPIDTSSTSAGTIHSAQVARGVVGTSGPDKTDTEHHFINLNHVIIIEDEHFDALIRSFGQPEAVQAATLNAKPKPEAKKDKISPDSAPKSQSPDTMKKATAIALLTGPIAHNVLDTSRKKFLENEAKKDEIAAERKHEAVLHEEKKNDIKQQETKTKDKKEEKSVNQFNIDAAKGFQDLGNKFDNQ